MKPEKNFTIAYNLLHRGTLALARAERTGICVDREYCETEKARLTTQIEIMEEEFRNTNFYRRWAHTQKTVNIHSNPQLSAYLYKTRRLRPPTETTSGMGSTDEEALRSFNIPELNQLLEIRKLKKIRDTYLDAYLREEVNGRIHPSFNLHLVTTYRSSSDRPNFQNIPKRDKAAMKICRQALKPSPGNLLMEADYSSIEVRIAACYHRDPTMLRYIEDPTTDMHRDMAVELFVLPEFSSDLPGHSHLRGAAKNGFVFPEFYGDYYGNCARNLACTWGGLPDGRWKPSDGTVVGNIPLGRHFINQGLTSLDKFTEHVRKVEDHFWSVRFPKYRAWKERWYAQYQRRGYIDLLTGFRCTARMSRNDCINYPVQGVAFHCLLWAFIEVDQWLENNRMKTRLIGQIHDAMVLDVFPPELPQLVPALQEIMCEKIRKEWPWIIVPLTIGIDVSKVDGNWSEMKKIED